jgi:hypothetical protein
MQRVSVTQIFTLRFKESIKPINPDLQEVLKLNPATGT